MPHGSIMRAAVGNVSVDFVLGPIVVVHEADGHVVESIRRSWFVAAVFFTWRHGVDVRFGTNWRGDVRLLEVTGSAADDVTRDKKGLCVTIAAPVLFCKIVVHVSFTDDVTCCFVVRAAVYAAELVGSNRTKGIRKRRCWRDRGVRTRNKLSGLDSLVELGRAVWTVEDRSFASF